MQFLQEYQVVCKNIVSVLVVLAFAGFVSDLLGQENGGDKKKNDTEKLEPNETGFEEPDPLSGTKVRPTRIFEGGNRVVAPRNRKTPKPKRTSSPGNRELVEDIFAREGGVSVTDRQGKRIIKILHDDEFGIYMEVTIKYGPDDVKQLTDKHPELADYIALFPRQIGDNEIGLDIAVKSKYQAETVEELQKQHPDGFRLYRRYYKSKGDDKKK